jgi:general secretion pathway protein D
LHDNDEVTLQLEFEIRSLAGTSVNGIPVITNRTLSQTVRLRENQTSIIAGLLDREETNALSGIPGFAALPGLGYAFGTKNKNYSNTELLFLVTPRRMRDRIRATRARYIGQGGGGGSSGAPPAEP